MKTTHNNILARLCGYTIALALFAGVGGFANANEQEKGAARQLRLSRAHLELKSAPSDYKPMSCVKCTDRVVKVKDNLPTQGLGARALLARGVPTKRVAKHGCEACGNTWVVSGHGKAKTTKAVHNCSSCGAESAACCSTSKGSPAATNGMENKVEPAAVK